MDIGNTVTFSYTGNVQQYTVETSGYYKLECWGGQGGAGGWYWGQQSTAGGKGGYVCGYKKLKKNEIIYVVVGAKGANMYSANGGEDAWNTTSGGYNGGGGGYWEETGSYDSETQEHTYRGVVAGAGAGGGATHIALNEGDLLKDTTTTNVLLVAGGGGGGWNGSAGFGSESGAHASGGGAGGNSATGSYGQGSSYGYSPSHYDNQLSQIRIGGGGGGGWNGGAASARSGGGGGSNYTDGVSSISIHGVTYDVVSQIGQQSGNGQAVLTLVKKITMSVGDVEADAIYVGDNESDAIYVGDNEA